MKVQVVETEEDYWASLLDDNGEVLLKYCSKSYPNFFFYQDGLYVVLGPEFGVSQDWEIYRLTKVA